MIEREIKVMLTEKEYIKLVTEMCKYDKPLVQINYYFDTDDLTLNKKGITCRVRYKDGSYIATVKKHSTNNPNLSTEQNLGESREYNPDVFNAFGLLCHGGLITERHTLYKNDSCEMVLDRNTYLEKTDFELEIEYIDGFKDKAEKCLCDIAELLGCNKDRAKYDEFFARVPKGKTKSERFFEELIKN